MAALPAEAGGAARTGGGTLLTPGRSGRPVRVAIVGAGMSGLCMGIELRRAGIDTFAIFEKADDLGGTWRENRYPGLTCDVPAPFYCYSFMPNPGWTRRFATSAEIQGYLRAAAECHGVSPHIRYGIEVVETAWEDGVWRLRTAGGEEHHADVLVAATGVLHRPHLPSLPGLERFRGPAFHSARWPADVELEGARVGVIGSGSTGIQIVTALSLRAGRVVQFQRTAQWVLPLPNQRYSRLRRALLRRAPRLGRMVYEANRIAFDQLAKGVLAPGWRRSLVQGLSRIHLRLVRDPALRARLTPDYEPLCKRLVISAGYYRAVQHSSVEVVTSGVDRVVEEGIVTADGRVHALDVIVFATGFDAHAFMRPMRIAGRDELTLADAWAAGPRAHRTVMLPGFPNLFLMLGPNSPIGNSSLVPIAEAQAAFAMGWIERMRAGEIEAVEPRAEAAEAFNREIRENMGDTVWVTGCDSWYIGPDGTPTLWPFSMERFRAMLARPDEGEYLVAAPARPPAAIEAAR